MLPFNATRQGINGGFDSSEIAPGKSWTHTVRGTGEFAYICTYHPLMKAVLRVR